MKPSDFNTVLEKIDSLTSAPSGWKPGEDFARSVVGDISKAPSSGNDHGFSKKEDLQEFINQWIAAGAEGWLLWMDQITILDGRHTVLPEDYLLAGELYRSQDNLSLAIRQIPGGWVVDEFGMTQADSVPTDPTTGFPLAFIETVRQMAITKQGQSVQAPAGREYLSYEVAWRLDPSAAVPVFKPSASRFTGWK